MPFDRVFEPALRMTRNTASTNTPSTLTQFHNELMIPAMTTHIATRLMDDSMRWYDSDICSRWTTTRTFENKRQKTCPTPLRLLDGPPPPCLLGFSSPPRYTCWTRRGLYRTPHKVPLHEDVHPYIFLQFFSNTPKPSYSTVAQNSTTYALRIARCALRAVPCPSPPCFLLPRTTSLPAIPPAQTARSYSEGFLSNSLSR